MSDEWSEVRKLISDLREIDPDDEEGNGMDEKTCEGALSLLDMLQFIDAKPPKIWWHGGDTIVMQWGADPVLMVTLYHNKIYVHEPKFRSKPNE